ncbi:MAG TPA: hypothetical protein VNC39_09115 [Acidocella sp.]|nr:hypothetical protein [Acidocella sp.]HVE22126.1 hypothetical protein [Acidocella sp.]
MIRAVARASNAIAGGKKLDQREESGRFLKKAAQKLLFMLGRWP